MRHRIRFISIWSHAQRKRPWIELIPLLPTISRVFRALCLGWTVPYHDLHQQRGVLAGQTRKNSRPLTVPSSNTEARTQGELGLADAVLVSWYARCFPTKRPGWDRPGLIPLLSVSCGNSGIMLYCMVRYCRSLRQLRQQLKSWQGKKQTICIHGG